MTQGRYIECLPCVAMLFLRKNSADIDSIYLLSMVIKCVCFLIGLLSTM